MDQKPKRKSHRKRVIEDIEMYKGSIFDSAAILTRRCIHRDELDNSASHSQAVSYVDRSLSGMKEQANLGSQTQQESQLAGTLPPDGTENQAASGELKRKTSKTPNQLQTRPSKRVKISLGPAVDLGD